MSAYTLVPRDDYSVWITTPDEKSAVIVRDKLHAEYKHNMSALGSSLNAIRSTSAISMLSVNIRKHVEDDKDGTGGCNVILNEILGIIGTQSHYHSIIVAQMSGAAWNIFETKASLASSAPPKPTASKFSSLNTGAAKIEKD